jgi:hypothetical protein
MIMNSNCSIVNGNMIVLRVHTMMDGNVIVFRVHTMMGVTSVTFAAVS